MRAPSVLSYWVFALGLVLGLTLGLAATRVYGPLQRDNAEPWQLRDDQRHHYMVAIALKQAHSGDLSAALDELIALRLATNPLDALAEAACELGSSGYLSTESGIQALRAVIALYSAQGRSGCAEQLLPPAASPTPATAARTRADSALRATAPPTKPPLPVSGVSARRALPTPTPQRRFEAISLRSFCDAERPAMIAVSVVDYLGRGLPGQQIRVRWGAQEDLFLSGLHGDRGDAYADFQMAEDIDYALDMPGAAEPLDTSLRTASCYEGNRKSLKSWRVVFAER